LDIAGNRLLHDMEKLNIIEEVTGRKRGKLYVFRRYIKLFDDMEH